MRPRSQIAAAVALAALALTGCGGGSDDRPAQSTADGSGGAHPRGTTSSARSSASGAKGHRKGAADGSPARGATGPSGRLEHGSRSRFPGVYAETVRICSQGPRDRVARDFGVEKASPSSKEIAEAVARGYKPRYRRRAFEGCSDGLALTRTG